MNLRLAMADWLIRLAYRLDPNRPAARTTPNGGWWVTLGGVPLAHVSAGQITTTRNAGVRHTLACLDSSRICDDCLSESFNNRVGD